MSNVIINKQKIDILANAISDKSGEPVTMTLDEMVAAVDSISTGGGGTPTLETVTKTYTPSTSAVTDTITPSSGYDGIEEVDVTVSAVPIASFYTNFESEFYTSGGLRKWRARGTTELDTGEGDVEGWISEGRYNGNYEQYNAIATGTTITPSTTAQTVGGAQYMMEGAVTVSAMPTGTAGTPTATKGTVSNHSVSVTPSVTNTTGYITGSTKTGTAVTVTASELASGNKEITENGTNIDVVGYSTVSVNVSGGGGLVWQDQDGYVHLSDEGGGTGGGLVYETGLWTPSEDIQKATITFSDTHSDAPIFATIEDTVTSGYPGLSYVACAAVNWNSFIGPLNGSIYGMYTRRTISADGTTMNASNGTFNNSTSLPEYITNERYCPCGNSGGYYWRSNRTYKWIAVWAPTS